MFQNIVELFTTDLNACAFTSNLEMSISQVSNSYNDWRVFDFFILWFHRTPVSPEQNCNSATTLQVKFYLTLFFQMFLLTSPRPSPRPKAKPQIPQISMSSTTNQQ